MRRTVERLEPGLGVAGAAILGLATLVMPFSTLLFPQVPAAALMFLSFSLLYGRASSLLRVAAAGAAAGLAVVDRSAVRGTGGRPRALRGVAEHPPSRRVRRGWARRAAAAPALRHLGVRQPAAHAVQGSRVESRRGRARALARPARVLQRASAEPTCGRRARAEPARAARADARACRDCCRRRAASTARPAARGLARRRPRRRRARAQLGSQRARERPRRLFPPARAISSRCCRSSCFALVARASAASCDGRRTRTRLRDRDGRRDERRAVARERRHAALALAHRPRQLHRDRRQPQRRRARLARDPSVLRARRRRGRRRSRGDPVACSAGGARDRRCGARGLGARRARRAGAPASRPGGAPVVRRRGRRPAPRGGRLGGISASARSASRSSHLRPSASTDHTKWALLLAACVLAALAFSERARRRPVPA